MRPTGDVASSPPRDTTEFQNLDSDMGDLVVQDTDFDFFNDDDQIRSSLAGDPSLPSPAASDPNRISPAEALPEGDQQKIQVEGGYLAKPTASLKTPSATAPSSSHSSSDFPHRPMEEDTGMSDWKADDLIMGAGLDGAGPPFDDFESSLLHRHNDPLELDPDFEMSNKAMENHFDFESAASSPNGTGAHATGPGSAFLPTNVYNIPYRHTAGEKKPSGRHGNTSSNPLAHPQWTGASNQASREASPLSAMVTSQESSPTALPGVSTPSPVQIADIETVQLIGGPGEGGPWTTGLDDSSPSFAQQELGLKSTPSVFQTAIQSSSSPEAPMSGRDVPEVQHTLTIHPTPLKSRVETQIPIKLTLHPFPAGVKTLHLPTHSISKPKLLAKPPIEKSPEMLELHTMLFCTSAMQVPENLQQAFARAAGRAVQPASRPKVEEGRASSEGTSTTEDDESKPLNGGEVNICPGCITRERKRAARKKVKKIDEETNWHEHEAKRVVVFNTHEIKEWRTPSRESIGDVLVDASPPPVPEGAMQIDAPMRIACYCRHQNEKLGFQVIFTIKNHKDEVLAQAITASIMITDDHKTHVPPPSLQSALSDTSPLPGAGVFPSGPGFHVPPLRAAPTAMAPFRLSHSSSDLHGLQQNFGGPFTPTSGGFGPMSSHTTSATMTPRNLSRQASPSAPPGHHSKKRKSSGSGKVPAGLAMTKLDTSQDHASSSHYQPNYGAFMPSADSNPYVSPPMTAPAPFSTAPPTPSSNDYGLLNRSQSMENLPMQPMYSAPTSTPHSRAASPNSMSRNSVNALQQAQMAQAVANGIYGLPLALNPHRPPVIHKMIPSEGPKSGGIEVTCLGSGFCQGLEVMFGGALATTTTYWGDTSLVCLLPPAEQPGTVTVSFKHQHQQQHHHHQLQQQHQQQRAPFQSGPGGGGGPGAAAAAAAAAASAVSPPLPPQTSTKQHALFKYNDDEEQRILRMALSVLGNKMTGRMEDVRDILSSQVAGNAALGNMS